MDKRGHPRFNSRFNAQLLTDGGTAIDCKVLDFSQDGIRIQWNSVEKHQFAAKEVLTLAIEFEKVPARIPVQILNTEGNTAGLKFHQPNTDLFLRLQTLHQKAQSAPAIAPEKQKQLQQVISSKYQQLCAEVIEQWGQVILDEIFALSSKAHNNKEQQNIIRVEQLLKKSIGRIAPRFLNTISDQMSRWQENKPAISFDDKGQDDDLTMHLSLIQQEDFEGWLLSKVTSSHLQSRLSDLSLEVHQVMDHVSGHEDACFNPVDAKILTDAYSYSIEPIKIELEYLKLTYEVFEKIAAQQLKPFYQWVIKQIDIPMVFRYRRPANNPRAALESNTSAENTEQENAAAENHQALDNSASQAAQQAMSAQPAMPAASAPGNSAPGSNMAAFQQNQAQAQQAYANIRSLMSMRYDYMDTATSGIPDANANLASSDQVEQAISDLWQQQPELPGELEADTNLRSHIEQSLQASDAVLPLESKEAIDTLEHITTHLKHNEKLPEFIKPYIGKLEWPLMKLMQNDASIMFNPDHPGRIALNSLAKLGRLTMAGQDIISDKLNDLLASIKPDSSDIDHQLEILLGELNGLVKDAERKAQLNADRVAQAAEGEFKVWQSRDLIQKQVSKDTAGRSLPDAILSWLEQGWKPLLSLILLREGKDSKRLKGAVKLYRQVISIFSDKMIGRADLLPKLTSLLQLMRHELDQLNGPRPEHSTWYDQILEVATQQLQGQDVDNVIEVPEEELEESNSEDSRGLRKALNLQEGDWLLRIDLDQPISIVWIAEDASRFACVNHSGMKVIDFSLEELAEAFDQGQIKRLYEQEKTAVDRSLDVMVQKIYNDLSAQANTDDLTELHTRQHFIRQLKNSIQAVQRHQNKDTLCFIDIDQFKVINSEYGVEGGDECLKMVAGELLATNDAEFCARMGSNEFAIIFTNADILEGEKQAKKLKDRIEQTQVISPQGNFYVRASLGLIEINEDTVDETDLVEFSESACFLAKEKGGSRVQNFEKNTDSRVHRDALISWGNKLNQALENDQLNLVCQPLINIQPRSANEHTYEVSVSIRDKAGEIIPPYEYLQSSEHYGRLDLVDRWVIEHLMSWMGKNPEAVAKIDRFMLKLSGHSMNDESLLPMIFNQSKVHQIPVNKLCFELNETAAIHDIEDATDFMHEMKSLGCQFILSDFGTGQASFQYLKELPVDFVKIDRALIKPLKRDSADYAMVRSIHDMASYMQMHTIAEEVDNPEVLKLVKEIGIDYAAGGELKKHMMMDEILVQAASN